MVKKGAYPREVPGGLVTRSNGHGSPSSVPNDPAGSRLNCACGVVVKT